MRASALAGRIDDYRLSFEGGETMTGRFLVTRLDYAGDFNGERSYTTPASGAPTPVELPDGEDVVLMQRLEEERLVQRFVSDDGERTNVFSTDDNGVTMQVTVESGRLEQPLRYTLRYDRIGGDEG